MGALITAAITTFRNRQQPIGYRTEISKLFQPVSSGIARQIRLSISTDNSEPKEFDNLHSLRIDLINKGNIDHKTFSFGVTLPDEQNIVLFDTNPPDRHHSVKTTGTASPEEPSPTLDFTLEPFNRGDFYSISLYINGPKELISAGPISLSSSHPVRFTNLPSAAEIAALVADGASLVVGPVRFTAGLKI